MKPHSPAAVRHDDPGMVDTFNGVSPYGVTPQQQDLAFQNAMQRAIARGRERATPGVKTADPNDCRVVLPRYATTHVSTASTINTD